MVSCEYASIVGGQCTDISVGNPANTQCILGFHCHAIEKKNPNPMNRQFLYKGSPPGYPASRGKIFDLFRKIKGPLLEWYPPGACQG